MEEKCSLLVVDISEDWEEVLKAHERGFFIEWDYVKGQWKEGILTDLTKVPLTIKYSHGSVRAGFNAIIDTINFAHLRGHTIYAACLDDGRCDGDEQPCKSILPYIPKENIFRKTTESAFKSGKLEARIAEDECKHLMVLGYDRDYCVLKTVQDAVARGIKVVTSEHIMLTQDSQNSREQSITYFRQNTVFLESLVAVWNYLSM